MFNIVAWWSSALVVCLILSLRPIGVTWDDPAYLEYFSRKNVEYMDWYHWIIDEPIWHALTLLLGSFLDARSAYRVILFVSPACFMLSFNKIAGGRWFAVGWHSWLILAGFLLDGAIGAKLYIAAIRQGLATSIFLLGAALRRPFLGAIFAGGIHSVFLIIAGVIALSNGVRRNKALTVAAMIGLTALAALLSLHFISSPLAKFDLGRRTDIYSLTPGLNTLGIVAPAFAFGLALFLCRRWKTPWLTSSSLFLPFAFALSVANPGLIRILLDLNVFMLLALSPAARSRRGFVAIVFFLVASIALALWDGRTDIMGRDSWVGLWHLALGG